MMLGWILKLILVWLIFRALVRLARGIVEGLKGAITTPPAVALVRDPVCGTFVAPATAPSFGTGAQTRFFCSENCRRIYQVKLRASAGGKPPNAAASARPDGDPIERSERG